MKFRAVALSVATAMMFVTAACGNDGASDGDAGDAGDAKKLSVGIVRFSPSEVSTEGAINAYVKLAEKAGWEVSTANPDAALDKAIGAMQDFVQKGVDLIIVGSFESASLAAGLKSATAAGIPVASIAGGKADGVTYDLSVANAIEVPEQMVKDLGGSGKVLSLSYSASPPCQIRADALDDALEGTEITVSKEEVSIPGQVESGQRAATAWLAKNAEGSGPLAIWGCWDDPAMGAMVAAEQAKRTDVKIYAYNATPPGVKAISDGKLAATAAPDLEATGKLLFDASEGLVQGGPDAKPQSADIPYTLITADTVADYLAAHPGADQS